MGGRWRRTESRIDNGSQYSEYVCRRARTHYGAMEYGRNDVIVLSTIGDDINVNLFDSWVFIGSGDRIFLNNIMLHAHYDLLWRCCKARSVSDQETFHIMTTFERVEWPILWSECRLTNYYSFPGSPCVRMHRRAQENVISFLSLNLNCVGLRTRNWIIRVDRCRRFPRSENRDLNKYAQSHSSYASGTQRSTKSEFSLFFFNAICLSCLMGAAARFTVEYTIHSISAIAVYDSRNSRNPFPRVFCILLGVWNNFRSRKKNAREFFIFGDICTPIYFASSETHRSVEEKLKKAF